MGHGPARRAHVRQRLANAEVEQPWLGVPVLAGRGRPVGGGHNCVSDARGRGVGASGFHGEEAASTGRASGGAGREERLPVNRRES
jgi:hypothetical protein